MVKLIATWCLPLLLLLSSCRFHGEKPARVYGTFPDGAGSVLVLQEMDTRDIRSVDSVTIGTGGQFSFTRVVAEPGFWLLRAGTGKILVLLLHPGDEVGLSGKFNAFPDNVIIQGPEDAMLLNGFFRSTRQREREVDSLETLLLDRQDSAGYFELTRKVDTLFQKILERQRALEMDFIDNNPGSLASLVVLNYAFGMNPVLTPDGDSAYYLKTDSALSLAFPGNKHVLYHHQRVEELKHKVQGHK
jgi:hypothetical protein